MARSKHAGVTSSDDSGYVHDPADFDDEPAGSGEESADEEWLEDPVHPEAADREFGKRGWVLVGVIVYAFVISPLAIMFWPMDVAYRFALLILPLVPAVLLAVTAVWATTRT